MDPNLTIYYANEGAKLDEAGATLLGHLTTPSQASQSGPVTSLRFCATSDASAVRTRVHQVALEGRLAQHLVNMDGTLSLFGAIEFRRINLLGEASGDPLFSVWFDDFGSYGVSNKVGYVSGNPPSSPVAEERFRNAVAGALYQAVQAELEKRILEYGS